MRKSVGILLAAGTGSRFSGGTHKQLYDLNGRKMVSYSGEIMSKTLSELVVVSNGECYNKTKELFKNYQNVIVLTNDVNCRLRSIETALNYIGDRDNTNIIIHDSARPFISEKHITDLIDVSDEFQYSQYFVKLVNGLARISDDGNYEIVDRDRYLELCTPQMVWCDVFRKSFKEFIINPKENVCEILSLVGRLGIKYKLIEGYPCHLRKITTQKDVY